MPSILGLIPSWAWRWIAIIAVGAALFGYGYVRGYSHEERKFALYQAQVDAIGKQAAAKVAETKAAQEKNTKEVRDGYAEDVAEIDAYYAAHPVVRVVRQPSRSGPMPAAADCTGRPDGAASESSHTGPDEKACALDAARVNAWIDFARKNGFPVR